MDSTSSKLSFYKASFHLQFLVQEYYRIRSKLQLTLLEELRSEHPDFPIKAEKFDKVITKGCPVSGVLFRLKSSRRKSLILFQLC